MVPITRFVGNLTQLRKWGKGGAEQGYSKREGGGVIHFRHNRSHVTIDPRTPTMLILAPLQCRDGARRVFTDQAGVACAKREAPCEARRVACMVGCIVTTCQADFGTLCLLSCISDDSSE